MSESCKGSFSSLSLCTDTGDVFYKTLDWDLNSPVLPLTVVYFVLQYLPTINVFSPSALTPFLCLLLPSPLLPGEGGADSTADVGRGAQETGGGREEAAGRGGPQAQAGGGGGEDEREALLSGQWSSGKRQRGETLRRGWQGRQNRDVGGRGG